jgi:predicted secreted protein|tara:strand:- start:102 stop:524 length:423 start_codon:yes stop_codon:yes gene_type:complete
MAAISGNTGLLQVDADGASTYSTIASLTSWTVEVNGEQIETTAMGADNKSFVAGQYSWTISAEMRYEEDDAGQELMQSSMLSPAIMYVKLYHTSSGGTGSGDYWSGSVVNGAVSHTASINDTVNVSFSGQGSGALTYTNA